MSNSVGPHRRQPTRLPRPWDSPGKNAGVGCHFLLQCMKVESESEVTQSCLTLSDPMDCSPPGSFIHGIFQARVLEWGATVLLVVKKPPAQAGDPGDPGLIPKLGRSLGEGNRNPFQYSWPRGFYGREALQDSIHGLQSRTRLSDLAQYTFW